MVAELRGVEEYSVGVRVSVVIDEVSFAVEDSTCVSDSEVIVILDDEVAAELDTVVDIPELVVSAEEPEELGISNDVDRTP